MSRYFQISTVNVILDACFVPAPVVSFAGQTAGLAKNEFFVKISIE